MAPKFCIDCKYSFIFPGSLGELKCNNPKVNSKNAWALGSEKAGYGVTCYTERDKGVLEFPACGMAGKQWTAKVV